MPFNPNLLDLEEFCLLGYKTMQSIEMAGFSKTQLLPTLHACLHKLCPMSSWTELSAVAFGQHVHLILIVCDFFFWGCLKNKVYNSNPRMQELKEYIRM
jgi:hypothetical protein